MCGQVLTPERIRQCKKVWQYRYIQRIFHKKRQEIGVYDSLGYYMQEIDRLFIDDPEIWNINDRLLTRGIATGATPLDFDMNIVYNRVWLCGGQRNERKKWDHLTRTADVVIWIVSLTSFQEISTEESQNGMIEALESFESVMKKPDYTKGKLWFVLFNRMDLFEEALQSKNLSSVFPEFKGNPFDLQDNVLFVMKKFADCISPNIRQQTMFVFDFMALVDCEQVKQWIERTWPVIHRWLRLKQKKVSS